VKPGSLVADLGCGSGVLSLFALQAGACHVYAIDNSRMLTVARESLRRCGFADRVSFIPGRSQKVELPQPVDVVVCDHVGWFGFDYGILGLLADARRRFLKKDGVAVPAMLDLEIAPVQSDSCRAAVEQWSDAEVPPAYRWLRQSSINSKHPIGLKAAELLGAPAVLGRLVLGVDQPDYLSWSAQLVVERDGFLHGLAGWFDCELTQGVRMTNSPLVDERIDRPQIFLPIDAAVRVSAGDVLHATITARPVDRLLGWTVVVPSTGQRFSHSTWQGIVLGSEDLARSNPDRVPHLTVDAVARNVVLAYCDGRRSAREIEHAVLRDHPLLFPSSAEISLFVAEVLGRDTAL
jgi:type I protein arginine methyltransferase